MSPALPAALPLAFIDCETTGLDERPGWDGTCTLWEVAVIRRGRPAPDGWAPGTWAWQLRVDPGTVDPGAAAVNRFHSRYLLDRPEHATAQVVVTAAPPDALATPGNHWTLADWALAMAALTDGAGWIGIVPDFDTAHCVPAMTGAGQLGRWPDRPWHYQLIDPEAMAAGMLGMAPPWDSHAIAAVFGLHTPADERHTALGDALYAMRLYDAVTAVAHDTGLIAARAAALTAHLSIGHASPTPIDPAAYQLIAGEPLADALNRHLQPGAPTTRHPPHPDGAGG